MEEQCQTLISILTQQCNCYGLFPWTQISYVSLCILGIPGQVCETETQLHCMGVYTKNPICLRKSLLCRWWSLKEYRDYSYKLSLSSAAGHSGRHDTELDEHLVQDNKANLTFWDIPPWKTYQCRTTTVGHPFIKSQKSTFIFLATFWWQYRGKNREESFHSMTQPISSLKISILRNFPTQKTCRILKMPKKQKDFWLRATSALLKKPPLWKNIEVATQKHIQACTLLPMGCRGKQQLDGSMRLYIPRIFSYTHAITGSRSFFI